MPKKEYILKKPHYFAVLTPGHSGSLWLSKLFNSHPEVLCWHEGVLQRIYPRRYWQATGYDIVEWFQSIESHQANHYYKIYQAIGDVGSLRILSAALFKKIKNFFMIYGLIRNGVLYVRSQMQTFHEFKRLPKSFAEQVKQVNYKANKEFPGLKKIKINSSLLNFFVFCCWRWFAFLRAIEKEAIKFYRLEDLNQAEKTTKIFQEITSLKVSKKTVQQLIKRKINPHLKEKSSYDPKNIYSSEWNKKQQLIFKIICGDKMKKYYP